MTSKEATTFIRKNPENGDFNQYWYSAPTIAGMVQECQRTDIDMGKIAFLSTPSVWFSLTNEDLKNKSVFFDIDKKWEKHPNFQYYDFKCPENLSKDLEGQFDTVVIDPPFIVLDVWQKYAEAAKFLGKPGFKVINSTVQENKDMMNDLFQAKPQQFWPSIPNLVYQYHFFCNFETEALSKRNPEIPECAYEDEEPFKCPQNDRFGSLKQ